MKDNIYRISVCPRCGQTYTDRPAISRADNTPICPDCGTREALESIGLDTAEQDKIIDTIHRCARGVWT
jgi:transposase-like protein